MKTQTATQATNLVTAQSSRFGPVTTASVLNGYKVIRNGRADTATAECTSALTLSQ